MAVSSGTVAGSYIGATIIEDTNANATAETGKASGGTLYQVLIDNTNNANAASFLKIYSSSPTVGTSDPVFIFPAGAGEKVQFDFPTGCAFASGLYFACVTTGGTAGTTSPTSAVTVRITIG